MNESLNAFGRITTLEIFVFLVPFILAIVIDLKSHKHGQKITMVNAAVWSLIWFLCAAAFGGFIFWERGATAAGLYATGYMLEKALAVDNLFAFYIIFKSFGLTMPATEHYQHRILYWGILGAIVFRVLFLGVGAFLVNLSPMILIAFALIVLWTVKKMWNKHEEAEVDYTTHWSVNFVKKFTRVVPSISSGRFFLKEPTVLNPTAPINQWVSKSLWYVTPLFLCLVCIEVCDIVFAFDSMPVIIAVVQDPYLMITSTLWAAAGLRSLYFLLVAMQSKFWALEKSILLLLILVSGKLIAGAFGYHLPNIVSISIITALLTGGVIYSLMFPEPNSKNEIH